MKRKTTWDPYIVHGVLNGSLNGETSVRAVSSNFFFFNDTATTEIYTLSLHDALPISRARPRHCGRAPPWVDRAAGADRRSEEHTSELQSPCNLVCRLLLEKKNNNCNIHLNRRRNDRLSYNFPLTITAFLDAATYTRDV